MAGKILEGQSVFDGKRIYVAGEEDELKLSQDQIDHLEKAGVIEEGSFSASRPNDPPKVPNHPFGKAVAAGLQALTQAAASDVEDDPDPASRRGRKTGKQVED